MTHWTSQLMPAITSMRGSVIIFVEALDEALDAAGLKADAVVDAGVVDEAIDVAEALFDFADCLAAAVGVFQVRFDEFAVGGVGLHLGHEVEGVF